MKRRNVITGLLLLLFTISTLSIDFAAATSRKELLGEFCQKNMAARGGFVDTNIYGTYDIIEDFTTYANIYILNTVYPGLDEIKESIISTRRFVEDQIEKYVENMEISKFVYSFKSALLVNATLTIETNETALEKIEELQATKSTYGFAMKSGNNPSLAATAMALEYYYVSNTSMDDINTDKITTFIINCWNSEQGAFAGGINGTATIIDSYFALRSLKIMNTLSEIDDAKITALTNFVETHYIGEKTNKNHYGGYEYPSSITQSSITATYYSVNILNMIGAEIHEETLNWLLDRQNSRDYGFIDYSETTTGQSSAKLSYFAVSTIEIIDDEAFSDKASAIMNEDKWETKNNGWVIAGIWVASIGVVVIGCIAIYKYKNRI